MALGSKVARRYAQALYEAAEARQAAEAVRDLLDATVAALWGDPSVRTFFLSDRVPGAAKKRLVEETLAPHERTAGPDENRAQSEALRLVRNCLFLVIDKRREAYLPEIVRSLASLVDRARGLVDVEVRTAVELGEADRDWLGRTLASRLGRPLRPRFVADPSLLGGLVVKVDDRLFDASFRRRLERLGEHLAKARVGV